MVGGALLRLTLVARFVDKSLSWSKMVWHFPIAVITTVWEVNGVGGNYLGRILY